MTEPNAMTLTFWDGAIIGWFALCAFGWVVDRWLNPRGEERSHD